MDEITIIASAASALLAAGVTRLLVKPESHVLTGTHQLETIASTHAHECNHFETDGKGWRCYLCWKAGVYTPMKRAERNRVN